MPWPRTDQAVWILIYSGMIAVMLGLFVGARDATLGWTLGGVGVAAALTGSVLVWVRSRLGD
jgi:hypothetical protein